jgi:hypothetical protein
MRRIATGLAIAALVTACSDPLNVENTNNPATPQVLNNAADLESAIGSGYRNVHVAQHHSNDNIDNQLKVSAFESYATANNYGMNVRAPVPRSAVLNDRGNGVQTGNNRDYQQLQVNARNVANQIAALDRLEDADPLFPVLTSVGRSAAARAFAFFSLGLSLGTTALVYDSAATLSHLTPIVATPLEGYMAVMDTALRMMDTAIAIANRADVVADEATFLIQASWIRSTTFPAGLNRAQFIQLVRSHKARFRAGVARTPSERAAVDWAAVIADAQNGLPNGLVINNSTSAGWDNAWILSQYRYGGWHNMPNHFIGMADTSGAYATWVQTKDANGQAGGGGPFLIRTPDLRFPSGETRTAQTAASPTAQVPQLPPTGRLYFRNRNPGEDNPTPAHGDSWYDHARFFGVYSAVDRVGPWPAMTRTELDMLMAEGYLRAGNTASAIALINLTRTTSGLPALTGGGAVPGGNACVPRVPSGANGNTIVCGDAWEAMKYEKRLETAMTGYGQWFFDSRGWGDLPEGTALHWPVPWQEMDARLKTLYSLGGTTRICAASESPATSACSAAAKSSYGAW